MFISHNSVYTSPYLKTWPHKRLSLKIHNAKDKEKDIQLKVNGN